MTAPLSLAQRLAAANAAFRGKPVADLAGIVAWAHAEVATASMIRMADDEDGPRLAIALRELGNPVFRQTCAAREEMERRVQCAWPELPANEVRRLMAHLDARVRAELLRPARGPEQQELAASCRGWVNGWRFDAHDMEATR
ncbi:hypothetical protein [Xanthomonas sacchari]|uniref:hypothetical protein n=1 Tax=Xanthomonas sacchari TaxID=56458 RepID=UPI003B20D39B